MDDVHQCCHPDQQGVWTRRPDRVTHTFMSVRLYNTGWVDVRLTAYLESGLHQWEYQIWGNEGHLGEGRACSHSQGVVLHQKHK